MGDGVIDDVRKSDEAKSPQRGGLGCGDQSKTRALGPVLNLYRVWQQHASALHGPTVRYLAFVPAAYVTARYAL